MIPLFLLGGGAIALIAYLISHSESTTPKTVDIKLRLTGYWPFSAHADELKMEGGVNDRKGHPLHTVEDFLAGRADHVSLSGDDAAWPYGQKILIPWTSGKTLVGRVTDTGGHFRGAGKVYHVPGYEPVDVCVESSKTVVPKLVSAQVVPGDNYEGGRTVVVAHIRDQDIMIGADPDTTATAPPPTHSPEDAVALARAVESSAPTASSSIEEQQAVAWACRNRAGVLGLPVRDAVAPGGEYGPRGEGGRDFVSTEAAPAAQALAVARAVLSLPEGADPTAGAVDFWCPAEQSACAALSDEYRGALARGDVTAARALVGYAPYTQGEDDVREALAACGLTKCASAGKFELLRADRDE